MSDVSPRIELPATLRPRDGRFGPGPSKVPLGALERLASTGTTWLGTSHRRSGVKDVVGAIRSGLAAMYELPEGYEVVLGNGGATAFWDAAAFQLIENRSLHYVFGEFSSKFAGVARQTPFLADPAVEESDPGTRPQPREPIGVDTVAFTHNETSTGVRMDPIRLGDEVVLVDATSAAGAIRVDATAYDAYYFSPQKAFASEGGLWVALLSPKAVARIGALAEQRWTPPFLDLALALANSRLDQTTNTPALTTLFLLREQIDATLEAGGLHHAVGRSATSSAHLYSWAERSEFATPFVADPAHRSPTVVTIDLDESIPATAVSGVLRAHGIVDTESYRKLGRNQLRIATFPAVDLDDVERLTGAIDYIVERLDGSR